MKVLIIPDVHLKPWMFSDADEILKEYPVDQIVSLGDLVDDWNCLYKADLYKQTLDAARRFNQDHPGAFWCYGNHDLAYLWDYRCSGTSYDPAVVHIVRTGFLNLYQEAEHHHGLVCQIDNVLFSHAGISSMFVHEHFEKKLSDDPKKVVTGINQMKPEDLWQDDSPLWLRPQKEITGNQVKMYQSKNCFQVVGHTPMKQISQEGNLLSCDVFSTLIDGTPYGTQEFCLFDTETWKWKGISCRKEN